METHYRAAKNSKPPSTWKTGLSREKRNGEKNNTENESKAIPTIDLSRMD